MGIQEKLIFVSREATRIFQEFLSEKSRWPGIFRLRIFNAISLFFLSQNYQKIYLVLIFDLQNNGVFYCLLNTFQNKGFFFQKSKVFFHFDFSHDYVAIYDGASKAFPMLGKKYCGTSAPPNLHSSGNQLLISFKSDSSVRHPGFQLFYSTRILTPLAVPLNL